MEVFRTFADGSACDATGTTSALVVVVVGVAVVLVAADGSGVDDL